MVIKKLVIDGSDWEWVPVVEGNHFRIVVGNNTFEIYNDGDNLQVVASGKSIKIQPLNYRGIVVECV